ncbi:cryptochrome/photolyase family protein [Tenacibaculum aiptasiae]|uniref:Cryptochrome/photolyase family protein n=1 Tax=Tenacibaculum aiptasiae TaxID=426481 RepID=A0A7J5AL58_9FLAO|nr:cryptochrome/photolyase family protein [Tenacibaculum aiptasiae]KAB1158342.1 cryptochrome/photolyase family protein [Tenacibaculum aiptasiae]
MKAATIVFPNQLFKNTAILSSKIPVYLVEEYLFFKQYNFHKQKLAFHRASMKFYQNYLLEKGFNVNYIESSQSTSDIRTLISHLIENDIEEIHIIDPTDNWLEKRIKKFESQIKIQTHNNPLFINSKKELSSFFKASKKKFYQTSFYKEQRIQRNILITNGKPEGGKWTYDIDNRKKYPKDKIPPTIQFPQSNIYYQEARKYISNYFPNNLGDLENQQYYPNTFSEAENWLTNFFETRFLEFGTYEDAIVKDKHFLNHSILSPLINTGLLCPLHVINTAITYASNYKVPINSLEGFIRQILGWREFIRGVYEVKGSEERTKNFWKHSRKIPNEFYNGTTGILPIDQTINKILKTGYAHHIERLMILGNFMLLCEFDPDEVYRWFMEFFIDSYDWVMVPNVYGMSLFSDGGLMSTKPYISSSNYIKKMSDYPSGNWQKIWDGLFWRFMDKNRIFLSKNPRLRMLINNLDKMDSEKQKQHFKNASDFLDSLGKLSENRQLNLL